VFSWKRLFLLPVLLCGCTHGFDRDALRERLNDGTLQSPDAAIAEARGLKPQLRFPCRIAVYLKPGGRDWHWAPEDRAMMEQWAATLKQEGIAADVFPLPDLLIGKGEVKDLRYAAAQCGADALFVIHAAAQTDSYLNSAAVLNLTVVGGYVVPASHRDTLFAIEGVLFDVDNGYIYTAVQAEGVGKIVRPTFVIEEKDAVALAKKNALDQFGDEVLKRMRTLAAAAPKPDRAGRIVIEGKDDGGDKVILSQIDLRPGVPAGQPNPNPTNTLAPVAPAGPVAPVGPAPVSTPAPVGPTTGLTPAELGAPILGPQPVTSGPPTSNPGLLTNIPDTQDLLKYGLTDQPSSTVVSGPNAGPPRENPNLRNAQQNAGGAMTGITAPQPVGKPALNLGASQDWPGKLYNAQQNAGGVMTGITAPKPNP
jgi:hypothetical protein